MKNAESMIGDSFTFNGKTYKGVTNTVKVTEELADGGFLERFVTTLLVRKNVLTIANKKTVRGKEIVLKGKTYWIVDYSEDNNSYTIEISDTNK